MTGRYWYPRRGKERHGLSQHHLVPLTKEVGAMSGIEQGKIGIFAVASWKMRIVARALENPSSKNHEE